mmetsp:Transcript_5242/g.11384  ORF Transcript_5242/g.11384 Transcript_5242/m.11384 type:complete len:417 (+) Transcript_5242:102-1352(+)
MIFSKTAFLVAIGAAAIMPYGILADSKKLRSSKEEEGRELQGFGMDGYWTEDPAAAGTFEFHLKDGTAGGNGSSESILKVQQDAKMLYMKTTDIQVQDKLTITGTAVLSGNVDGTTTPTRVTADTGLLINDAGSPPGTDPLLEVDGSTAASSLVKIDGTTAGGGDAILEVDGTATDGPIVNIAGMPGPTLNFGQGHPELNVEGRASVGSITGNDPFSNGFLTIANGLSVTGGFTGTAFSTFTAGISGEGKGPLLIGHGSPPASTGGEGAIINEDLRVIGSICGDDGTGLVAGDPPTVAFGAPEPLNVCDSGLNVEGMITAETLALTGPSTTYKGCEGVLFIDGDVCIDGKTHYGDFTTRRMLSFNGMGDDIENLKDKNDALEKRNAALEKTVDSLRDEMLELKSLFNDIAATRGVE